MVAPGSVLPKPAQREPIQVAICPKACLPASMPGGASSRVSIAVGSCPPGSRKWEPDHARTPTGGKEQYTLLNSIFLQILTNSPRYWCPSCPIGSSRNPDCRQRYLPFHLYCRESQALKQTSVSFSTTFLFFF